MGAGIDLVLRGFKGNQGGGSTSSSQGGRNRAGGNKGVNYGTQGVSSWVLGVIILGGLFLIMKK